jgi:MtN3 and saliva related transmembrane protein
MDTGLLSLIGFAAAFCTTAAYVPQVWRIWRTRSTADISLGMFVVMNIGVLLWLIYGIAINSAPVIACNGTTLVLASTILILKIRGG